MRNIALASILFVLATATAHAEYAPAQQWQEAQVVQSTQPVLALKRQEVVSPVQQQAAPQAPENNNWDVMQYNFGM